MKPSIHKYQSLVDTPGPSCPESQKPSCSWQTMTEKTPFPPPNDWPGKNLPCLFYRDGRRDCPRRLSPASKRGQQLPGSSVRVLGFRFHRRFYIFKVLRPCEFYQDCHGDGCQNGIPGMIGQTNR